MTGRGRQINHLLADEVLAKHTRSKPGRIKDVAIVRTVVVGATMYQA